MSATEQYSALDRLIHRIAFSSRVVQLAAADLEMPLFGARFKTIRVESPIFITSLPRAGTTMVLDILARAPELAAHCYRDMPFVLAPLLWDVMSRGFRKPATLRDRAHGDGVKVGYDSPEAFEEIVWRAFWPDKFTRDVIELWHDDEPAEEFRAFFTAHIQKIISVRSGRTNERMRYVSKNNANIARLGLLRRLFPTCIIVVPFRDPVAQATSLLRQHTRFLALHREDPFSRRYMDNLGHLEFGELHRPIDFSGTGDTLRNYPAHSADYWLTYWIHAFRHILRQKSDVVFVSYERLCAQGISGLRAITQRLEIHPDRWIDAAAADLREPRSSEREPDVNVALLDQSRALHDQLLEMSVV